MARPLKTDSNVLIQWEEHLPPSSPLLLILSKNHLLSVLETPLFTWSYSFHLAVSKLCIRRWWCLPSVVYLAASLLPHFFSRPPSIINVRQSGEECQLRASFLCHSYLASEQQQEQDQQQPWNSIRSLRSKRKIWPVEGNKQANRRINLRWEKKKIQWSSHWSMHLTMTALAFSLLNRIVSLSDGRLFECEIKMVDGSVSC